MTECYLKDATAMSLNIEKNLFTHILYPLIALILASLLISTYNIDQVVADYFYQLQGGTWAWKNSWLAEQFFHKGGRNLSIALALVCIAFLAATYFYKAYEQYRKPLLFLVLAVAGSSASISIFKATFAVSCPWEFARYGGNLHYHTVIEQLFLRNGSGCFPAGQASAGYSWIALYFVGLYYQASWRWLGLAAAIITGVVLGTAQQIRGAHFISHDIWTLAICWFFSLSLYYFMFKKQAFRFAMRTA